MKKIQLQKEIENLKNSISYYGNIIDKLLNDYIQIKPIPRGKIKERIVVFEGDITCKKIDCEIIIIRKPITTDKLTFHYQPAISVDKSGSGTTIIN